MGKCDFFFSPPSHWVAKLLNHLCEYVNLNVDGPDLGVFIITVNVVVGLIIASFQCQFIPIQPENISTGSWLNFGKMSCSVTSDTKKSSVLSWQIVPYIAGILSDEWDDLPLQYNILYNLPLSWQNALVNLDCRSKLFIVHLSKCFVLTMISTCSFFPIHLPDPLSSLLFPPLTS